MPRKGRVNVADGLEAFEPADFLAAFDRNAVLHFEVQLHGIAKHAGGKFG